MILATDYLRIKRDSTNRRAALVPSNRVLTVGTSVYVAEVAYDRRRTRSQAWRYADTFRVMVSADSVTVA